MIKGGSNQPIGCNIRSATTGAPWTTPVNVYVKGDLNAQALGTVGGGSVTPNAQGYAEYVPSAAETSYDHIAFTFDAAGAIGDTVQVNTISPVQIQSLQSASGLLSQSAGQVVIDALYEIRVARAGDDIEPELMAFGIRKLNRLLDRWNANPRAQYNVGFNSYTPIPNHTPHTLGPNSADWTIFSRPAKIRGANLILNNVTPAVRIPIDVRDQAWWLRNTVQGLATSFPTDLYYDPGWPNGSVYLWPIPTSTYPIELMTDNLFGMLTDVDTFWMPYAYLDAIVLTLAEELAPGTGQTVSQSTRDSAKDARALIFSLNDDEPRIATADAGLPSGRSSLTETTFNYRSRTWPGE